MPARRRRRARWSAAVVVLGGTGFASVDTALYDADDRIEVVAADPMLRESAASVAALFHADTLSPTDTGRWRLPLDPAGAANGWCAGERFASQPGGASCTGFLIGSDRMATSAHCIRAEDDDAFAAGIACADARFVFDYRVDADGRARVAFDANRVYRCTSVLGGASSPTGADWRVVELDRPPIGRDVLPVYGGEALPPGTPLEAIGHPNGLPAKVARAGRVVRHADDGYFVTDLDAYRGNSGSPVLARIGGRHAVVGLLSRGAEDFERAAEAGCERSRRCDVERCGGEHATSARELADWPQRKVHR